MNLLLFKTNIKTKKKVKTIAPTFNNHVGISNWSVDTEDIDNVLRIEAEENLKENDVISLVENNGFSCMVLAD